jgi:hypothetical protein
MLREPRIRLARFDVVCRRVEILEAEVARLQAELRQVEDYLGDRMHAHKPPNSLVKP